MRKKDRRAANALELQGATAYDCAYGDGYAAGKEKAHFELRHLGDHLERACQCDLCETVSALIEQLAMNSQLNRIEEAQVALEDAAKAAPLVHCRPRRGHWWGPELRLQGGS